MHDLHCATTRGELADNNFMQFSFFTSSSVVKSYFVFLKSSIWVIAPSRQSQWSSLCSGSDWSNVRHSFIKKKHLQSLKYHSCFIWQNKIIRHNFESGMGFSRSKLKRTQTDFIYQAQNFCFFKLNKFWSPTLVIPRF